MDFSLSDAQVRLQHRQIAATVVSVGHQIGGGHELRLKTEARLGQPARGLHERLVDVTAGAAEPSRLRVNALLQLSEVAQRLAPGLHLRDLACLHVLLLAEPAHIGLGEPLVQPPGRHCGRKVSLAVREHVAIIDRQIDAYVPPVPNNLLLGHRHAQTPPSPRHVHGHRLARLPHDHRLVHADPVDRRPRQPRHDRLLRVRLSEPPVTHRPAHRLLTERHRAVLSAAPPGLDPGQLQRPLELRPRARSRGRLVDLHAQQLLHALPAQHVVDIPKAAATRARRDRQHAQSRLATQCIGQVPNLSDRVLLAPELPPGLHVCRVEDDVVVDVIFVQVSGDHILVPAPRDLLRELHTELVCLLCRDLLPRLERLNHVMGEHAALTLTRHSDTLTRGRELARDRPPVTRIDDRRISRNPHAILGRIGPRDVRQRLRRRRLDLPHLHDSHHSAPASVAASMAR